MPAIAALLTSHNRRDKTRACLRRLFSQRLPMDVALSVLLVDDGSTDGTAEAVASEFPVVRILREDGNRYWSGGMRVAIAEAMRHDPDYYLWLNDDVELFPDAASTLLAAARSVSTEGGAGYIVAGSLRDPEMGRLAYGGVRRMRGWHPLRFEQVHPANIPVRCETMNGNCVLVPREVGRILGNLDPAFRHSMSDFDYGLRARKLGISIWLAPGFVGTCSRNDPAASWEHMRASLATRWGAATSPKGLPPREWAAFARRHAGPLWPVFWALPYLRLLLGIRRSRA